MNKEKLSINREACKRMLNKNMDLDYIKEITSLSKKQIKYIKKVNDSFIGDNDLYLRKRYASNHHLIYGYYLKHRTLMYTGVDLDKSDFYKNRYIQNGHPKFKEDTDAMKKYHANMMTLKAILRIVQHMSNSDELLDVCKLPYSWDDAYVTNCEIYNPLAMKVHDLEEKKLTLNLLSVEENLRRVEFITNLTDNSVEEIKEKNSIFFSNKKLNLKKLEKEKGLWEMELKHEIAKRSTTCWYEVEKNTELLSMDRNVLEEYSNDTFTNDCERYLIRKEIVGKLMQSSHSVQDMSEISGLHRFYVDGVVDGGYYNRYFEKYYDKYKNERLIDYEV